MTVFLVSYVSVANFQLLSGMPYQSFLFKIKGPTVYTLTIPCGLTQYVPTDSCLDPVSAIPMLQAHCLLPLLLSSRLLPPLILLCIYKILRHTMNILTVNMYWQTAA